MTPTPKKRGRPRKVQPVASEVSKVAEKQPPYKISLETGGQVYESEGATPFEALSTLPKPEKLMQKGALTCSHGLLKRTVPMTPLLMKRLFFTSKGLLECKSKQVFMTL